jgi:hypothetical protein
MANHMLKRPIHTQWILMNKGWHSRRWRLDASFQTGCSSFGMMYWLPTNDLWCIDIN